MAPNKYVYDKDEENRDLLVGSYHSRLCLACPLWNILDGDHYRRSVQMVGSGAVYSVTSGLHRLLDHRYLHDVIRTRMLIIVAHAS